MALTELAGRAGLSVATIHNIEAGRPASLATYARLATVLGLRLEATMVDPRRRSRPGDPVHAAMGEVEVAVLRGRGHRVAIDEPYQHFQFAGRADVVAWSEARRALLHIENRTRFPDFQEAAGAFNTKRAYLGRALAERLHVPEWRSETHVMAVAWTAEAIHDLRRHEASIRSICPDPPTGFESWWTGEPPASGRRAELIVLDPSPNLGRRRRWVELDQALVAAPRHRGYVTLVDVLDPTTQTGIGASRYAR
jgi:hypothetical protein